MLHYYAARQYATVGTINHMDIIIANDQRNMFHTEFLEIDIQRGGMDDKVIPGQLSK